MSSVQKIVFNRPTVIGNEFQYMQEAVANGKISGDGAFTHRCHELFEQTLGVRKALLTTSCTHALEMAAILLDIQPGDEVIVPSFTFVSSINAFILRGARPVFIDIRPDTLNMDETRLEALITPKTKVILPVHYAGVACEMDTIMAVAQRHNIAVVEDNAHGLFGKYRGRYLGTFGCLATQSFHETKNFSCGEGGALLINDEALVERAEIIREKGTNRSRFFRGQVDKYTWVDVGSSYLPSDMLAGFLYAQLEQRDLIQAYRKQLWDLYATTLKTWAQQHGVCMPTVPEGCEQAYHMFYLLMPSLETRQAFIAHMRQHDMMAVFHYLPLHRSPFGQQYSDDPENDACPITTDLSDRLVRLPFSYGLSFEEQERVIDAVLTFRP